MMTGRWMKLAAMLVLPLTLTSCLLTPGAFTSTLDLRRDGSFTFAYKGEMVFQSPDELMKMGQNPDDKVWKDDKATCYKASPTVDATETSDTPTEKSKANEKSKTADPESKIQTDTEAKMTAAAAAAMSNAAAAAGSNAAAAAGSNAADAMGKAANATDAVRNAMESDAATTTVADNATTAVEDAAEDMTRPCTKAEIAEQKKDWETERKERDDKAKKDAAQFGAIFGFTPGDDAANKKLAATIMRYDGWKSVVYKGDGVFDVDYVQTGRIDHDFIFPTMPQAEIVFPFVSFRIQKNGAVRVNAPALIGGGLRALASRMKNFAGAMGGKEIPASTRTKGSFTITTDGDILTNNTEDGPAKVATGRQLVWDVGPDSDKVPEALVKLK